MSPRIGSRSPAPLPHHSAAAAPRAAAARPPTATPSLHARDTFEHVRGGQRADATTRAASATYGRHGDVRHDLTSRDDVGRLISRSPQLDDLRGTTGDGTRCGGAALFNAMLLDGAHDANATAIERMAATRHLELTEPEHDALRSMHGGHLTPHEAAVLQDTTYRIADTGDGRATGRGLSGIELTTALAGLRGAGGLPNTSDANFRMERTGPDSFHWTTTTTTAEGTAHADSWPQANGYARVGAGPGATDFHHGGRFDDAFMADVTISQRLDGTHLRTRSVDALDAAPTVIESEEVVFSGRGTRPGEAGSFDPATGARVLRTE